METVPSTPLVLRKVALMTLIGFMVIVLSGPIIAVAAALLPFALIGFVFYLLLQALILGPRVAGKIVGETFRGLFHVFVLGPARLLAKVGHGAGFLLHLGWSFVAFLLAILLPTVLGGVVGGALGVVGGIEHQDADMRIPAGIVIGAAIGAMAGFMMRGKPQPKRVVVFVPSPQAVRPV
jgi:hypothetical protein